MPCRWRRRSTASTASPRSAIAWTMFWAPATFVLTASAGWYSQVGTCFIAAAWKTTSAPLERLGDRVRVADVADHEGESAGGAPRRRRCRRSRPGGAGTRAASRAASASLREKTITASGTPDLALEEAADQHLPERAGAAGDEHALSGQRFRHIRPSAVGVGELGDHLVPARRRPAGRRAKPRRVQAAVDPGLVGRSISMPSPSAPRSLTSSRACRSARRRRGRCLPGPGGVRDRADQTRQLRRRRAAEQRPPEAGHGVPVLRDEPFEQAPLRAQLPADHRGPQGQHPGPSGSPASFERP